MQRMRESRIPFLGYEREFQLSSVGSWHVIAAWKRALESDQLSKEFFCNLFVLVRSRDFPMVKLLAPGDVRILE